MYSLAFRLDTRFFASLVLGVVASSAFAQVRDGADLARERERDAVIEHRFQTEVLQLLAESCQDYHGGEARG